MPFSLAVCITCVILAVAVSWWGRNLNYTEAEKIEYHIYNKAPARAIVFGLIALTLWLASIVSALWVVWGAVG